MSPFFLSLHLFSYYTECLLAFHHQICQPPCICTHRLYLPYNHCPCFNCMSSLSPIVTVSNSLPSIFFLTHTSHGFFPNNSVKKKKTKKQNSTYYGRQWSTFCSSPGKHFGFHLSYCLATFDIVDWSLLKISSTQSPCSATPI